MEREEKVCAAFLREFCFIAIRFFIIRIFFYMHGYKINVSVLYNII